MKETVERFSNRAESYARYRPGYPPEILELLATECGLSPQSVVADVGSGTGKLSEIFLQFGNTVFAVEPNPSMRKVAESLLGAKSRFKSVDGSAESTGLASGSIDFITAGQAFHWFDLEKTRPEFARVLKPSGWAVIIWNERRLDSSPFLQAYEKFLIEHGTDYQQVRHENVVAEIDKFFAPQKAMLKIFENLQEFDFEGLAGRISSTSYTPEPGTEAFLAMLKSLREVFDKHATAGQVVFEYQTKVYYGRLH